MTKNMRKDTIAGSDGGRYDYIIVGAGSAGAALAYRLSEKPGNKVLLIEAGKAAHPLTWLPVSFALYIDDPAVNWRYRSEPEEGTNNRLIPVPRGKLLGGSSAINGMIYVRGQPQDYDDWAQRSTGAGAGATWSRCFGAWKTTTRPSMARGVPAAHSE